MKVQPDIFINIGGWSMDLKPVEKGCPIIILVNLIADAAHLAINISKLAKWNCG